MKLNIIPMTNPILYTPCEDIPLEEITSPENQDHYQQMRDIYNSLPAVGLAAPQVGWSKRVFLVGIENQHAPNNHEGIPLGVYINPKIEIIDDTREEDWEACFSVYHQTSCGMLGQVKRYKTIRLTAYNEQAETIELELSGYNARVFQHENDHLDGIRYINRMGKNSEVLITTEGKEVKITMAQIPKALRSQKLPILKDIVPVIANAPSNKINAKLVKEIVASGKIK